MTPDLCDKKGFTLTELMVSVGISSFVAYGIFATLISGDMQMETMNRHMEIQDSGREGVYRMLQEIRQSASGRVVLTPSGGQGFDVIEFQIPDPAPANFNLAFNNDLTVNWTNALRIQYARGGANCTQLIRTLCAPAGCPPAGINACGGNLGANQRVVANNVEELTITNPTVNVYQLTVGMQDTARSHGTKDLLTNNQGQDAPLRLSASAQLRNR